MRKHTTKLILNPNADMGKAWQVASDLRPIVEQYGGADWSGTVYPTHAIELAKQAAEEGYETVIAAGGDGTVHEVVNGLLQVPQEKRPKLGVVPLGSGNDFAHNIGMSANPAEALQQVFTGNPYAVDAGWVEDGSGRKEFWNNTLGVGFDATVTIRTRNLPLVRGFMLYLTAVIQTIFFNHEAPHIKVVSDNEQWEDDLLMLTLCNGPREGGGFFVAPEALLDDGIFHYVSIRKVSRLMMFRILPEVLKGTHERLAPVKMGTFKTMEIHADRSLRIHADGEIFAGFGTNVKDLKIGITPAALVTLR